MDRCRCEDYAAAVKNLKFYTLGTYRPDIIENYDSSKYVIAWQKNSIIPMIDHRYRKPIAWMKLAPGEQPKDTLPERSQQINQMWCPYMTLVEKHPYESR